MLHSNNNLVLSLNNINCKCIIIKIQLSPFIGIRNFLKGAYNEGLNEKAFKGHGSLWYKQMENEKPKKN